MRTGNGRRHDGERGAAAVEFAIVASVFITLLLGIVEFGVVLNDHLAVRYGSADGAREAAVGTTGGNSSCNITGSATGASASTKQLICLTKDRVGLDTADVRVKVVLGTGGYVEQGRMAVCVQHPIESRSGFFQPMFNGKFLQAKSEIRIEDLTTPAMQSTEETPPSGSDWSWCTLS